jgi:hypothetical protein
MSKSVKRSPQKANSAVSKRYKPSTKPMRKAHKKAFEFDTPQKSAAEYFEQMRVRARCLRESLAMAKKALAKPADAKKLHIAMARLHIVACELEDVSRNAMVKTVLPLVSKVTDRNKNRMLWSNWRRRNLS